MKNERSADDGARAIYRPAESECSIREQAGADVLAERAMQDVLIQPAHPLLEMLEIICRETRATEARIRTIRIRSGE